MKSISWKILQSKAQGGDNLWTKNIDAGRILQYHYHNYMINMQITKVVRVGTSLAVVIPVNILRGLFIERGDQVVFSIAAGDVLCMRKITDAEKLQIKPPVIQVQ